MIFLKPVLNCLTYRLFPVLPFPKQYSWQALAYPMSRQQQGTWIMGSDRPVSDSHSYHFFLVTLDKPLHLLNFCFFVYNTERIIVFIRP